MVEPCPPLSCQDTEERRSASWEPHAAFSNRWCEVAEAHSPPLHLQNATVPSWMPAASIHKLTSSRHTPTAERMHTYRGLYLYTGHAVLHAPPTETPDRSITAAQYCTCTPLLRLSVASRGVPA